MTIQEKISKYFFDEDAAISAITFHTRVAEKDVYRVIDMMPEKVLSNISQRNKWYSVDGNYTVGDNEQNILLSNIRVWIYQGIKYIMFLDSSDKMYLVPTYICPNVLEFVVENIHNIAYIRLRSGTRVRGLFDTMDTDWGQLTIIDKENHGFKFTNSVPKLFTDDTEDTDVILTRSWDGTGSSIKTPCVYETPGSIPKSFQDMCSNKFQYPNVPALQLYCILSILTGLSSDELYNRLSFMSATEVYDFYCSKLSDPDDIKLIALAPEATALSCVTRTDVKEMLKGFRGM